jgi:hypothetical protein
MPYNRICFGDRGSNQSGGLESSCGSGSSVGDRATSSMGVVILEWVRIPPSLRGSVDVLVASESILTCVGRV